jgi:hypothetical protein
MLSFHQNHRPLGHAAGGAAVEALRYTTECHGVASIPDVVTGIFH